MPLPLIAIGSVAVSAIGSAGGAIATLKTRRDKKRYDARRRRYEQFASAYRGFVCRVSGEADDLHNQRVAAQGTLRKAADFLVRANVRERSFDAEWDLTPEEHSELKDILDSLSLGDLAAGAIGGAAGGAALGGATAAGAYAAVGVFGTASTGAAIGGLAGAAARNATLAWLGGGSLAAGGGGMAAGAVSLASIGLAPVAVIPAIVIGVKAVRQGKRIDSEVARMDVSQAEMDKHGAELATVQGRVREMSKSLIEVEGALKDILESASAEALEDVYRVASVAKALVQLLDMDEASGPTAGAVPAKSSPPSPVNVGGLRG